MSGSNPQRKIDEILTQRKVIVTCGTGGVGKTTLSAAMAMRAAMLGKRAAVITIDPAKRLATSLGLDALGDHPTDLTPRLKKACENAQASGISLPGDCKGTLAAIMPDTRKTFENFVHSLTDNHQLAARVIKNPIFQIFAKEFSGTNEYMALEMLYATYEKDQYDCIILDTPPSRNTLDFLEAPQILSNFFDEKVIKWLVVPANRFFAAGMRKALEILERLTGSGFMGHLFEFAQALFDVRVSFQANLKRITELLESRSVGFLLVASATPENADEIGHFVQSVQEHRFHFEGIALNRTLGYLKTTSAGPDSSPEQSKALELIQALQQREDQAASELRRKIPGPLHYYSRLPELARDVHSVEDLFHVALALDPNI